MSIPFNGCTTGFQSSLWLIGAIGEGAAVSVGFAVGLAVGVGFREAQAATVTSKTLIRLNRFMFTGEMRSPVQSVAVGNYACRRPCKQVASLRATMYS